MQVWSTVAATQAGAHPWAMGFAHQPGVGWGGAAWAPEAATTYRSAGRADIGGGGQEFRLQHEESPNPRIRRSIGQRR